MNVTVAELDGHSGSVEVTWERLVSHCGERETDLVLLPEMPFSHWLAAAETVDPARWQDAVAAHDRWLERLPELSASVVAGTRPVTEDGRRYNEGFVWDRERSYRGVHRKTYLPDEPGFHEATWYDRGPTTFEPVDTHAGRIGFLICTEMWFLERARAYGKAGAEIIVTPRATEIRNAERWRTGGRIAAFVSACFHLSSAHAGIYGNLAIGGGAWIADPTSSVLATTSAAEPFATVEIDLDQARAAKSAYPLYVDDSPVP
jgi:predicted amidohydrolase